MSNRGEADTGGRKTDDRRGTKDEGRGTREKGKSEIRSTKS